jgi:hypothetical protein
MPSVAPVALLPHSIKLKGSGAPQQTCPYLGLLHDPTQHRDEPTAEHCCCHLGQQDRIDLAHQRVFCLTADHRICPWLMWRDPKKRAPYKNLSRPGPGLVLTLAGLLLLVIGLGFGLGTGALSRLLGWKSSVSVAPPAASLIPFPLPVDAASVSTDLDVLPSTPHPIPGTPLTTSIFTATAPRSVTASLSTTLDGLVVAGNIAFFFPRETLSGLPGPVNVEITANPTNVPVPGGMTRLGANNSLFGVQMTDGLGRPVTTLPQLATMIILYNHTDLAVARNDPNTLAAGYLVNSASPAISNPLGLEPGTWLFFPPSLTSRDGTSGTLVVQTQVIPYVASIIARPAGEVETLEADAPELSSPSQNAVVLNRKGRLSRLLVVEPQIGTRLLILDPDSNNYAFVNTTDVGLPAPQST